MKAYLFILCSFWSLANLTGQIDNGWEKLSKVESRSVYNAELGFVNVDINIPDEIKAMDGEFIEVEGYIIPLTGQVGQNNFMFSRYPKNQCFFCGAAGPESAMEVFMSGRNTVPFTSDRIRLKGRLEINEDDISGLIYSLTAASRIK